MSSVQTTILYHQPTQQNVCYAAVHSPSHKDCLMAHNSKSIRRCPFVLGRVAGVKLGGKKHSAVLTLLSVLCIYRSCVISEENSELKECFQRHIICKLL